MREQLTFGIATATVQHQLTADERAERERLRVVCEQDRARRDDELQHQVEQAGWRRRAEEAARRRELTPAERAAEEAARAQQERVQAAIDWAEEVECLVLDAELCRAHLALEAAGVDRHAKLVSLCAEVREGLDVEVWKRWCRLAGLDVERADRLADEGASDEDGAA